MRDTNNQVKKDSVEPASRVDGAVMDSETHYRRLFEYMGLPRNTYTRKRLQSGYPLRSSAGASVGSRPQLIGGSARNCPAM